MNRKFATIFAAGCIVAALGAVSAVAYRVLAQDYAGRESAKADFEGLRSVLAYVKGPSDLAEPGLRARLASRYEANPSLLLVDIYERGEGDRWRIPADSPYLASKGRADAGPEPSYPPSSTILLSAPLKGDSSGKLAVDALYVSIPQASAFEAFRDSLIGLGAFLALAALALAIVSGREGAYRAAPASSYAEDGIEDDYPDTGTARASSAASELAAAAAHYQFETLAEEEADQEAAAEPANFEGPGAAPVSAAEDDFDIPVMDIGMAVKSAPEDIPPTPLAAAPQPATPSAPDSPKREVEASAEPPSGLYSPSSSLGWESYMKERLDAEIARSASFEQDLSLLAFSYDGLSSHDQAYSTIGKLIKEFFSFRDMAFERGDDGFSIILPNIDSAHALRMAEEFNRKLVFLAEGDYAELELLPIYMGISSRAGRLVDAGRLIEEAATALEKARYEKDSHIVAFRPDPDKYRIFLASKGA
jgi:GGDEF domain-containing protein